MTIEPGKLYRTRDGRKAFIGWVNQHPDGRVYGLILGEKDADNWTHAGKWIRDQRNKEDLIAEWSDEG